MEGNREVIILRPLATSADVDGGALTQWATHLVTWARVRQPRGGEWRGAPLVQGQRQAIFRIRWSDDVRTTDRVLWDATVWDITAVLDADAGRRWLDLHAVETPT